jgi:hypothetical protein
MNDSINEDTNNNAITENQESSQQNQENGSLREVSYVLLFIGAVFVINAMETGSYRTPWPVAIITSLAGIGLFVYSLKQRSAK